eukprot:scaffold291295_cov35-Tisochrysis_lutea.AAC.2
MHKHESLAPTWNATTSSSSHQLVFIHIPKCAGSSFRKEYRMPAPRVRHDHCLRARIALP